MKLTKEQKYLLLDHCFHCVEQEQFHRNSDRVQCNPQAAKTFSCLKHTLSQLDHIKDEKCPTGLVEMTITRLQLASATE